MADLNLDDDVDCANHPDKPSLESDKAAVDSFISLTKGQCFMFNEMFPGRIYAAIWRRYRRLQPLLLDSGEARLTDLIGNASFSMGHSQIDYFIYNTINASLGPATPTHFNPRSYVQDDMAASLLMGYPIEAGLHSPLNLAVGVEYRSEAFETLPGDEASYTAGEFSKQGFSVGSNGYQGPESEICWPVDASQCRRFRGSGSRPFRTVGLGCCCPI